MRYNKKLF